MYRKMLSLVLVAAMTLALLLTACSSGSSASTASAAPSAAASTEPTAAPADNTVYTMNIAHNIPETDPAHLGHANFKKLLEEKSGGRIKVNIYSGGSVAANDREILEKVADGTTQFGTTTPGTLGAFASINDYYLWNIPYIYLTREDSYKLSETTWQANLNDQFLTKTGVKVWNSGFTMGGWVWGTTKKDLASLDVLKGMKMRISDVPQQIALTQALGAAPMFISFNEVFTTLQQGTVDGLLTTASLMYTNGFYENLKYIKLTDQAYCYHMFIINNEWYSSLPADLQKIFDECLVEAIPTYRQLQLDAYENALKEMTASGVKIYECTAEEKAKLLDMCKELIWSDPKTAQVSKETINSALDQLGYSDQKLP